MPGDPAPVHHHAPVWAMALAFAVGALVAAQSRINGQLAIEVGNGLLAAVVSFGTGLVLVLVLSAVLPGPRRALRHGLPAALRRRELRWWHLVGGALGATLVAAQGLVVPLLGVALFTVVVVAGNTVASMASDRLGIGPGGRRPVTVRRVLAAAGAVLAVALAVSGRATAGDLVLWALALALLGGAGTGVQPALNGQVAARTGEPLVATVVNFVVGTAVLLLALGLARLLGQGWTPPPAPWDEPVLWLGGPIGVAFILTAAVVVRPLGVLLLSLLSTSGQLTGALVVDVVVPTPGTVITWQLVAGVALTIVAVALAAVRRRT